MLKNTEHEGWRLFVHWQAVQSVTQTALPVAVPFMTRRGHTRLSNTAWQAFFVWAVITTFSWSLETRGAEITWFLKVKQFLATSLTHPYMVIPFICESESREHVVYANRHKHWDKGGRGVCRARSVVAWIQVFTTLLARLKRAEQVQMWCRLSKRNTLWSWNQRLRIKNIWGPDRSAGKAEPGWTPTKRYVCCFSDLSALCNKLHSYKT